MADEAFDIDEEAESSSAPMIEGEHDTYIRTGVPGFDDLFEHGIPQGAPVLISGGAGAGKTIFCLQTAAYHASRGEKCVYLSFEESEEALKKHMRKFGWDPEELIDSGNLVLQQVSPFKVSEVIAQKQRRQETPMPWEVAAGKPDILPDGFEPDYIFVDSLTAVASVFTEEDVSYRGYLDRLFNFFEQRDATIFLVTETSEEPAEMFSPTGVEEFLADGVIVLYNIKHGNVRESAVEVLKMRGAKHEKKMVAMQIGDDGITVYPDQEVLGADTR